MRRHSDKKRTAQARQTTLQRRAERTLKRAQLARVRRQATATREVLAS